MHKSTYQFCITFAPTRPNVINYGIEVHLWHGVKPQQNKSDLARITPGLRHSTSILLVLWPSSCIRSEAVAHSAPNRWTWVQYAELPHWTKVSSCSTSASRLTIMTPACLLQALACAKGIWNSVNRPAIHPSWIPCKLVIPSRFISFYFMKNLIFWY